MSNIPKSLFNDTFEIFDTLLDKQLRRRVDKGKLESLRDWLASHKHDIIHEFELHRYYLNRDFEQKIFDLLLDKKITGRISHYTSLDAAIKIITTNKIRLTSIIGLNDNSELDFSDISEKKKEPYHYKRIDYLNRKVVLSLSRQYDNLNQWRLYGDDGSGVSLDFDYYSDIRRTFESFYLRGIFYGNELIIALRKLSSAIQSHNPNGVFDTEEFERQKYFFKDPIFADEKEVRLFSDRDERLEKKWYYNRFGILNSYTEFMLIEKQPIFPLKLKSITLGPKCPNADLNKAQLQKYIRDNYPESNLIVNKSKINSYR